MTRRFSLSVSRFATAAVSVAVAGAIVLSTPQSGAAQVTSSTYFTGGYMGGIAAKLTECDLAKTKAQTAFVACITKAQAKGQAASGAYFMEECDNGTGYLHLPVALRDEAACVKTLAKAFDSADTRHAGCTTKIPNAQEFVDWAFGPVGPQGFHTGGHLTPVINCTVQNIDFNYSGSIVQWTAPQTGSYQITAYGAQGGGDWGFGGSGAIMRGTFHLNQGNVLNILVGGQGAGGGSDYVGNYYAPSGGGGSFVAGGLGGPSSLLVVAGGGGGVDPWTQDSTDTGAADASTGTSGKHATGTDRSSQEGAGGTDGSGGTIGIDSASDGSGGGGGGFSGNGGSHVGGGQAQGGFAYLNGGAGGAGGKAFGVAPPNGGFGGGGGGGAESGIGIATAPGGGGGYSGGGGAGAKNHAKGQSKSAGGGGSYLAPSATDISKSVGNTGYGLVTIDLVTSAAPAALSAPATMGSPAALR